MRITYCRFPNSLALIPLLYREFGCAAPRSRGNVRNPDGGSSGVKQFCWGAAVPEPPHAQPHLPEFPFAAKMLSRHFIGRFIGVLRRDNPGVLLFPAATLAQLDLIYLHSNLLWSQLG